MAVDPHPWASRREPSSDPSRGRTEVVLGILGVDPAFDRMATQLDVLLANADRFTTGDAELLSDQIHSRHHFGDGMLHLNPGVHLHEIEPAVAIQKEFDRAGAFVIDAAGCSDGGFAHPTT